MLFGYLLGIAIISAISALLIKLSAKLVVKKRAGFASGFIISFISFLAALFVQNLVAHKQESLWAVLPGIIFFLACWFLNVNLVKYGEENDSIDYGRAFLITVIQCAALFIITLILSIMFLGGLMYLGSQAK